MRLLYLLLILTTQIISQNGVIKSYFVDGSVKSEQTYIKDILDGLSVFYYPNGNIKTIMNYSEGKVNGWVRNYYDTGLLESENFVNNGVRDGSTRFYYENGGLKSVIVYKRGMFISQDDIPYDINFVPAADDYAAGNKQYAKLRNDDRILCDVEICPAPIGGMEVIQNHLVYPEKARLYGLEGIVTVTATISSKGEILSSAVIKGLGLGLDEAAIDAVNVNRFLPGKSNDESVISNVTIKVKFELDEDEKQLIASSNNTNESFQEPKQSDVTPVEIKDLKQNDDLRFLGDNLEYNIQTNNYRNFDCNTKVCPAPIGGPGKIIENFITPRIAYRKDISGEVVIIASIGRFGYVRNTRVIKGLGYGVDEAAEVAILDTKFNPATENGERISSEMIIVIPVRK